MMFVLSDCRKLFWFKFIRNHKADSLVSNFSVILIPHFFERQLKQNKHTDHGGRDHATHSVCLCESALAKVSNNMTSQHFHF